MKMKTVADPMNLLAKTAFLLVIIFTLNFSTRAQSTSDTTRGVITFSGSLGFTNNGSSIIPSFSFNKPASIILLSWKKGKFSVDPDIRVTPDGKKGSMLLWFRYQAIQSKRFNLRTGIHPAINWSPTQQLQDGISNEVLHLRRFLAWEIAPSFQVTKNFQLGIYYLQGNGLQRNGVRTSHFVTLNSTVTNIPITKTVSFAFIPAVYYLYLDGADGAYFTATGIISHRRLPFTIQSTINKTMTSNLPANKDFLWNVAVFYNFKKAFL